jgi:hypothetical protein
LRCCLTSCAAPWLRELHKRSLRFCSALVSSRLRSATTSSCLLQQSHHPIFVRHSFRAILVHIMIPAIRKKRAQSSFSGAQPRTRLGKTKPPANRDSSVPDDNSASNPQATLSGLPPELRLEIYTHLCTSTLVHVNHHHPPANRTSKFTWTPCLLPHPPSPLLCATPNSRACALKKIVARTRSHRLHHLADYGPLPRHAQTCQRSSRPSHANLIR